MNTAPRTLSYNPAENAILMTYDAEGGSYELHILPKDPGRGDSFSVCFLSWNLLNSLDFVFFLISTDKLASFLCLLEGKIE